MIKEGETTAQYVERRIHGIFWEIAEMVNETPMSEEESAGVPIKLFQGEALLINVWRQFVGREM